MVSNHVEVEGGVNVSGGYNITTAQSVFLATLGYHQDGSWNLLCTLPSVTHPPDSVGKGASSSTESEDRIIGRPPLQFTSFLNLLPTSPTFG